MPRPKDPQRIRFGATNIYEVDPDWSYYGSLIFQPSTGRHVGWVNGRAQTGWQVFHTGGNLLGTVLLTGEVNDYRGSLLGQIRAEPGDADVLDAVARILDAGLDQFE